MKINSLCGALCGAVFLPSALFAQYDYIMNGNSTITITGYGGPGGALNIPSTINGLTVTSIGVYAFENLSLFSVTLPSTVTNVGAGAFEMERQLSSVTLDANVLDIGADAFYGCPFLRSMTIPASVTNIGSGAFADCADLTSISVSSGSAAYTNMAGVLFNRNETELIQYPAGISAGPYTIPTNVTTLGDLAFAGSSLTSVTIPAGVTNIGVAPFEGCSRLAAIGVSAQNTAYTNVNGVLFSAGETTLVEYPGGLSGSYTLPSTVAGIADSAFADCTPLTSVTIPASVTNIAQNAFNGCSGMTSVSLGLGVSTMGTNAFQNCPDLTNFTVNSANAAYSSLSGVLFNKNQTILLQCPAGVTGTYTIPGTVTNIAGYGFAEAQGLTGVTMPDTVNTIGPSAFFGCGGLKTIAFPNAVTSISPTTFFGCPALANVTFGSGVTNIGEEAFLYCTGLTNLMIPSNVNTLSYAAFNGCSGLTNVILSNGVANIGDDAFAFCSGLTTLVIPASVTNIGSDAFAFSANLASVYFNGGAPAADATVFIDDSPAIYYNAATAGWGATFGGLATTAWNASIQAANANFGIQSNAFGFMLTGPANIPVIVQATTDLAGGTWINLQSCALTNGSIFFSDPAWTNYPTRIYRVMSPFP